MDRRGLDEAVHAFGLGSIDLAIILAECENIGELGIGLGFISAGTRSRFQCLDTYRQAVRILFRPEQNLACGGRCIAQETGKARFSDPVCGPTSALMSSTIGSI